MAKTNFQVYTYFGRVISNHACDHSKELHHRAAEEARKSCAAYAGAILLAALYANALYTSGWLS